MNDLKVDLSTLSEEEFIEHAARSLCQYVWLCRTSPDSDLLPSDKDLCWLIHKTNAVLTRRARRAENFP